MIFGPQQYRGRQFRQTTIAYSDDFNRANGSPGANWAKVTWYGSYNPTISSNQAIGNAGGGGALLWVSGFGTDHESQIEVIDQVDGTNYGTAVRGDTAAVTWYGGVILRGSPDRMRLHRLVSGSYTVLQEHNTGDGYAGTILTRAVGSALKSYRNGVLHIDVTDSTLSTQTRAGLVMDDAGTMDNWEGSDATACPMVPVEKEPVGLIPLWVKIIGSGSRDDPWRVDLPDGVDWSYDDSIVADMANGGRPLCRLARVMVPAAFASTQKTVEPDEASLWLWRAVVESRKNTHFVPAGGHPPREAHTGDRTDKRGVLWPGHTWPSYPVPRGTLYVRPRPFVSMPSVDDEADKDRTVESYVSAGRLDTLSAGLDGSAGEVFARMADAGVDKSVQAEAVRQLLARGLSEGTADYIADKYATDRARTKHD